MKCDYTLDGLTEHRCPECGQPFDPDKPWTYAIDPSMRISWLRVALVLLASYLLTAVVLYWAVPVGSHTPAWVHIRSVLVVAGFLWPISLGVLLAIFVKPRGIAP